MTENKVVTGKKTFVIRVGGALNKMYYIYLIVLLLLGDWFLISMVEDRYQKTVIPSIVEHYEDQLTVLREELFREKMTQGEPEKLMCYSKTEVIEILVNDTDTGAKP